jgi:C1A family cysteine protease
VADKLPQKFHLKELAALTPIFDQKNCGSCVYNSVAKNLADSYIVRGILIGPLSRQYWMDCGVNAGSCSGDWFENVASIGKALGNGLEFYYPYKANYQSCYSAPPIIAKIESYKIIDNSPRSIMSALFAKYPISVTVSAGHSWSSYSSGIFNGKGSYVNHEVLIYGWDCQTSVDDDGYCTFNSKGYPKNKDGYAVVVNSWGANWGENGEMRSRWGAANLAEEAGILEIAD